jgi:hypothetical protein
MSRGRKKTRQEKREYCCAADFGQEQERKQRREREREEIEMIQQLVTGAAGM